MINITLKQLRYFEALADAGHFGRAASHCSISQPALSVQIKDLEQELGHLLFERGARQVRLTRFGQDFALRVRAILRRVDDLDEFARASASALAGSLRLGIIPTIAPYALPRIIGAISKEYPNLDLHVRETLTPRLVDELSDGRIDLAIVALPVEAAHFTEFPMAFEEFVLVRPRAQSVAPVPGPDDLADLGLLILEEGHCFRDQALSFCQLSQNPARSGLDGSTLSTLVQMVGAGLGITLIPQMAVEVETRGVDVDVVTFPDPQPGRRIGMIWRKSSPLEDAYSEIAKIVTEALQADIPT